MFLRLMYKFDGVNIYYNIQQTYIAIQIQL